MARDKVASDYVKEPSPARNPWHQRRQGYTPEPDNKDHTGGKGKDTKAGTKRRNKSLA